MQLTPKQELFAQMVASGKSQSEAYRESYNADKMKDSTIWSNASRLMENSKVLARIEDIRATARERASYTLSEHLERLDKLSREAEKEGRYSEAIKAEELRGKASGFYTDKVEHKGAIDLKSFVEQRHREQISKSML